jgi:UMF1 family MFS transporter
MNTLQESAPRGDRAFAYAWFDFANSSISLIFHAYLFPLYVKTILFGNRPVGDTVWGLIFAFSVLCAAVLGPFIGRVIDGRSRFGAFRTFAFVSFATIFLLSLVIGRRTWLIIAVFVVANVAFYIVSNLYDSLLTVVAEPSQRQSVSSFAWGFGYLGGVTAFVVVFFLQRRYGLSSPLPYLFTAIFYATFGIFALYRLKPFAIGHTRSNPVKFADMLAALDRTRIRNLVGFWLISDCVNAIIVFTGIYAATQLGMTATMIGLLLLIVQVLAFPGTLLMNLLASRFGVAAAIQLCCLLWCVIIATMVFGRSYSSIGIVLVCTSLVIGSTQALMRAQYSMTVGRARTSELFGWYALATESAAFLAPVLFGLVSGVVGNQRLAMAVLAVPLLFGMLLLKQPSHNGKGQADSGYE